MPAIDHWKDVFLHFPLRGSKNGNTKNVISYSTGNSRIRNI
jgi:hypothetical protein